MIRSRGWALFGLWFLLVLYVSEPAHATQLGTADALNVTAPAYQAAADIGSRTSRIIIDPNVPIGFYDETVRRMQSAGLQPQVVIGGYPTSTGSNPRVPAIVRAGKRALKRWPKLYSLSILNEPEVAGIDFCKYRKVFQRAYFPLKRAGAKRILFGEFSPVGPDRFFTVMRKCGRIVADGFAWHAYDNPKVKRLGSIRSLARMTKVLRHDRKWIHDRRGRPLRKYITELGAATRGQFRESEQAGAASWRGWLRTARKWHVAQIVAYHVHESGVDSDWDTSLVRRDGSLRPAYTVLRSAYGHST